MTLNNKPTKGGTALAVSTLVDSSNPMSITDLGMGIANCIPNEDIAKTLNTVKSVSKAMDAVNSGNMLGAGLALAGAVPGSDFSEAMGKVSMVSNAYKAIGQQDYLSAAMSMAGLDPNSQFAKVMGDVSKATDYVKQGLAVLNPMMSPEYMIKYLQPPSAASAPTVQQNGSKRTTNSGGDGGKDGAYIKGEGLKCLTCALVNQEAMVGAPVQALYGSKVLSGEDDIDYTGIGYLPFSMSRTYNSQNPDIGWFGQGWTTQGYEQCLELDPQHNRIYLVDNTGRRVPFTYLTPGQSCYQPSERITLYRKPLNKDKQCNTLSSQSIVADAVSGCCIGDNELLEFVIYRGSYQPNKNTTDKVVDSFEGLAQHYSYVASRNKQGTKATILLSSYGDKYGQQIQLHYTRERQPNISSDLSYIPQYLTDDAGGCYEFEFITISNQHHRLSKLFKVDTCSKDESSVQGQLSKTALSEYSYNEDGDLIQVKRQGRVTRTFGYHNHLMIEQSKPQGLHAVYKYDSFDSPKTARIVEQRLSNGRHYLFNYETSADGTGVTTVTEQPNTDFERSRCFEYDEWYNLLSLTSPSGATTAYRYDEHNRTIKIIKPSGAQTLFNYQGIHLSSVHIQTSIDKLTKLPKYREVSYQYIQSGQVKAIIDSLGNTQQFSYNLIGELASQTNALGYTTNFAYDKYGNIIQQTLANGSSYHFDYDRHGNLTTQTDCSGYQAHYQYDDKQRLTQNTDAEGKTTLYYYKYTAPHLDHLLTQVTYPDGSQIKMDYDDQSRLITHTDAEGHTAQYQYDENNQTSKRTQTVEKDEDRLKDHVEKKENTISRIDEAGQALAYHYDILGRLINLTNENGETWVFNYNETDQLIYETRFDEHQSSYKYDPDGLLTLQIDNPHLKSVHQQHIHNEYNLAGDLITRHYSHYPSRISKNGKDIQKASKPQYLKVRYEYNEIGHLVSAVNPSSRIEYDYDANGWLTKETIVSHSTQFGAYRERVQTLTHDYDELGNRTKTVLPDKKELNQACYGSGHLYNQSLYNPTTDKHIELRHSERNKIHQETNRQQGRLHTRFHYDPMGRLLKQQTGADSHISIERHYNYEVLGQLTHLSGHSALGLATNNNTTTLNQFRRNHQYQYDILGRLTEHKLTNYQDHSGITEVFGFDPASNRVAIVNKDDNASSKHVVQGRPQKLINEGNTIRYIYDTHGRVLYKTIEPTDSKSKQPRKALQLQYNAAGELEKSLTREYQGNKVIQIITTYHYDAFSRRIAKHIETREHAKDNHQLKAVQKPTYQHTHMLWDGDKLIQEYSDNHVFTTVYDQASFAPVARLVWLREETINEQVSEQDKDWLAKFNDKGRETRVNLREVPSFYDNYVKKDKLDDILGIKVYYYHNDQLGTPNELTNKDGQVIWLADFEAWGNTSKEEYQSQAIGDFEISAKALQPIRFQGQSFDAETGLHYNRFRYYDPDMGMFISRDPIGLMGGDNVFVYAPNPTGWIDPLGLNNYGMGMFQDYGNSPGMKWAIHDAKNYTPSPSNARPDRANTTHMTNISATGRALGGVEIGGGWGKSYDKNGVPTQCYSISPCATGGTEARVSAGINKSITDSASTKGLSYSNQKCLEASATYAVGANAGVCTGNDRSTTSSGGVSFGAGTGLSGKVCRPLMWCPTK